MSTFITRLSSAGTGPRLAVKDLIDVEGVPTTAGSAAVARDAAPALIDAECLRGARAADARIVGKANLHELAFGTSGVNRWSGTPVNPLDPALIPGGSSSGSAVAVGAGEADLAFGSDTGGSIRIPAAFCGVTGLKTSFGRVPLEGVRALAPSFDTVGPMARDVAGTVAAMALLEPGFAPSASPARVVGRLRPAGVEVDPLIDAAIDRALSDAGFEIREVELEDWEAAYRAGLDILLPEAAQVSRALLEDPTRRALIGPAIVTRLESGLGITPERIAAARVFGDQWRATLQMLFSEVELVALPSVAFFPPPIEQEASKAYNALTLPVNLAGVPALSLPLRTDAPLPASLQLVGLHGAEDLLVATGALVEAAAGHPIR
jgi:amidase